MDRNWELEIVSFEIVDKEPSLEVECNYTEEEVKKNMTYAEAITLINEKYLSYIDEYNKKKGWYDYEDSFLGIRINHYDSENGFYDLSEEYYGDYVPNHIK